MYHLTANYWRTIDDVYIDGDKLVVEFGASHPDYKNIDTKVGYYFQNVNNSTTFSVEIKCGNGKYFSYRISGSIYGQYVTLMNSIISWWKNSGKSFKKKQYQQSAPPPPKAKVNEKDPVKNRERRLNLLRDTLDGYERELERCKDPVRIKELKIEINTIKGRIKVMEQPKAYENLNHLVCFRIFE